MNKTIVKNFSYLLSLQVLNVLLPLITYPYLIRTLGTENYGEFIYNQGIIGILSIIILYGFDLTGAKLISENRKNKEQVAVIFSNILSIRLINSTISFFLFVIIAVTMDNTMLFMLCAGMFLDKIFFPQWYFQGVEDMKYIAIINFIAKILTFFAILGFINNKSDLYTLPIIYSTSSAILSIAGIYFALKVGGFRLIKPTFKSLKKYYNLGFDYFYSSILISVKDRSNILLLGYFFSGHYVVLYDLMMKVISMVSIPISILNNVTYPSIVRNRKINALYRVISLSLLYSIGAFCILNMIIYNFDMNILSLNDEDKKYFYMMFSTPVFLSISQAISRNYLNAFGYRKQYMLSVSAVTFYYFCAVSILLIVSDELHFINYILTILSVYIFELVIRLFYFFKCRRQENC